MGEECRTAATEALAALVPAAKDPRDVSRQRSRHTISEVGWFRHGEAAMGQRYQPSRGRAGVAAVGQGRRVTRVTEVAPGACGSSGWVGLGGG